MRSVALIHFVFLLDQTPTTRVTVFHNNVEGKLEMLAVRITDGDEISEFLKILVGVRL